TRVGQRHERSAGVSSSPPPMLRGVQPQQRTSRIPPQGGRQIICRAPCNALCEIFMPSRNTSPPLPNNGSEADACCSGLIHYFPCSFCERASGEVEQETLVTDMPMAVEGGVIAQMNLKPCRKHPRVLPTAAGVI